MAKPSRSNVVNREPVKQLKAFVASHLAAAGLRHSRAPKQCQDAPPFVVSPKMAIDFYGVAAK